MSSQTNVNKHIVDVKSIIQRILTEVLEQAQMIITAKLEARQIFTLNFKGTQSRAEHKTIFGGLKITNVVLSGQSDAPVRF